MNFKVWKKTVKTKPPDISFEYHHHHIWMVRSYTLTHGHWKYRTILEWTLYCWAYRWSRVHCMPSLLIIHTHVRIRLFLFYAYIDVVWVVVHMGLLMMVCMCLHVFVSAWLLVGVRSNVMYIYIYIDCMWTCMSNK